MLKELQVQMVIWELTHQMVDKVQKVIQAPQVQKVVKEQRV